MSPHTRKSPLITSNNFSSWKYIILNIAFQPASSLPSVMIRTFATFSLNPPPLFTPCSSLLHMSPSDLSLEFSLLLPFSYFIASSASHSPLNLLSPLNKCGSSATYLCYPSRATTTALFVCTKTYLESRGQRGSMCFNEQLNEKAQHSRVWWGVRIRYEKETTASAAI